MDSIFNDPESTFFKSAIPIHVGPIDNKRFKAFLIEKFKTGKRTISPEVFDVISRICFDVPGDVQQLCSALWETTSYNSKIKKDGIIKALEQIFAHEFKGYETILKVITTQHLKILSTLASVGGKGPMSSKFLKKSGISQASSVHKAVKRLVELKIIFYFEDEYRFVNPFFRAWLIYKKL